MNRLCLLLGLPLASLALAACGDDEPDKFASRDSFCNEWALQACNISIVEECADDKADCEAGQRAYCKEMVTTSKYNKAGAKKCADAIGKALVDAELTPEELALYQRLEGDCSEVVSGSGGKGDSCSENSDCSTKDGLRCVLPAGEVSGKCQEPRDVGAGDECDGAADVCPSTHFCDAAAEACLTLRDLNDDCSLAQPCNSETMCVNEAEARLVEGEEEGVCVERGGNQDDCMVNGQCVSNICSPNMVCVSKIDIDGDSTFNSCEEFHN
jgi:hypothetical protein